MRILRWTTLLVAAVYFSGILPAEDIGQIFFCRERGKPYEGEPLPWRTTNRSVAVTLVVPLHPAVKYEVDLVQGPIRINPAYKAFLDKAEESRDLSFPLGLVGLVG